MFDSPEGKPVFSQWKSIQIELPPIGELLWFWDGRFMWIGERGQSKSETWAWSATLDAIWQEESLWRNGEKIPGTFCPIFWMDFGFGEQPEEILVEIEQ
jgi:hypothetical protein